MGLRQVELLALVIGGGGLAWWLSQQNGTSVYAPLDLSGLDLLSAGDSGGDAGGDSSGGGAVDSGGYLAALSQAEDPSGDPFAKNPYSSASGLYQFTKATWTALGGAWGSDPTKAFGGLTPSTDEQTARAQQLTDGNASLLTRAGAAVNSLTLYAAHIFGPSTAAKVLNADPSTPLANLVGGSTVAKNPALGSTVASFVDYLTRKVGAA